MSTEQGFSLYAGDGRPLAERGLSLPPFEPTGALDDPAGYIAGAGLRDAVNVALMLGQPLLVTGEPGTGKTQLAASVAHELGLPAPLVFHAKTTSAARDLFYRYDALGHFHDAHFRPDRTDVEQYVTYEALGLAILLSLAPEAADPYLPAHLRGRGPTRSVVLLDEIDKAPRDLPNDVLNEIESLTFTVKETGRTFAAEQSFRPVVILTSNSEKNLPDAFLRRCVFYHIPFPTTDELRAIVRRRLRLSGAFTEEMLAGALAHFEKIRELALKKKPATAELLAWLRVLDRRQLDVNNLRPGEREALALTYAVLAKSREDRDLLARNLSPAR
ncbi:MAG TPA: MoxR family ATPase [Pyrinomonadaceae bacterium]